MRVTTLLVVLVAISCILASPRSGASNNNKEQDSQTVVFVDLSQNTTSPNNSSTNGTATEEVDPEPWRKLIEPLVHTCPMDCNYRGVCELGFCICRSPFWGTACEREMCGHNQECNGRGTCINNTISAVPTQICMCDDGWTGTYCDMADDECPYDCLDHGECVNGVCNCTRGWVGDYCETISCPQDCSGHGQCLQNGELGGYCNCSRPWYTESCVFALCPNNCTGNGVCEKLTGVCSCNETYVGTSCELRLCPNNCTFPHGLCDLHTGGCKCDPRYRGADCSDEVCPNVCNERGTCHPDGHCECDPFYGGSDCSRFLCFHNCSMAGECQFDGSCICDANFTGAICEVDMRCPNNCSGNGKCVHAQCNCTGGWSSWDCSVAPFICPDDFHCVNGNCTSGACQCKRGWQGFDCTIPIPRMCSGNSECYHGKCDESGHCVCDWPWTGDFCERYMAHPLPIHDGGYDIPDPLTIDTPLAREQKLEDFEEIPKSGRCGQYGGKLCASPIYRRPHPRTPSLRIPMGIRHAPHRAKANATHAANGTFWGDIWGNATAMWEEIHEREELDRETALAKAESEAEAQAHAEPPPESAQPEQPNQQTQSQPTPTDGDASTPPPTKNVNAIQTAHYHNLRSARKHYYNARRKKQASSNGLD